MSERQPCQNNTAVSRAVKQTLTLAVLTEPRADTCTCLYGEPKHTAALRLIIFKATLEDQINVSVMEIAVVALPWHVLGLQMVPSGFASNGTGDKVGLSAVLCSRRLPLHAQGLPTCAYTHFPILTGGVPLPACESRSWHGGGLATLGSKLHNQPSHCHTSQCIGWLLEITPRDGAPTHPPPHTHTKQ